MCPQKHSGVVDLILFFNIFYSSNQEIENELSKFDEEFEKDLEEYRNKKLNEIKKPEEQQISTKSKSKEKANENFENGNEIDYDDDINNEEDENNYGDDEDGLKDDEEKD